MDKLLASKSYQDRRDKKNKNKNRGEKKLRSMKNYVRITDHKIRTALYTEVMNEIEELEKEWYGEF